MLNHIALQYSNRKKAEIFFDRILKIKKESEFSVSPNLAFSIFGMEKEVEVIVFGNDKIKFEVFISNEQKKFSYEHICLNIPNKEEFVATCKNYGIQPIFVKKGDKELLFIRDFENYLYEIKEKIA